jgi:hypothetical protein
VNRGRIRSIKPEFIVDGKIAKLSDSCALFFVMFWTQCDDEGKHLNDALEISTKLGGRWKQDKVKTFIKILSAQGQLDLSSDSAWVRVASWFHQKINRPVQPKVKAQDIQWLTSRDSLSPHCQFTDKTPQGSGSDKDKDIKEEGEFEILDVGEPEPTPPPKPNPKPAEVPPKQNQPPSKPNIARSPEDAATAVMIAIDKFGSGTRDKLEMEAYLGPRLYKVAINVPGGLGGIRAMDRTNTFRAKLVAGLLKETAERMGIEVR